MKLKPEVGGDQIKVELNDRKDGTYLAEYTVDMLCGKLTLSVCLRGAHIKGSPFAVNVTPLIPSIYDHTIALPEYGGIELPQPTSASTVWRYQPTSISHVHQPASASTASHYQPTSISHVHQPASASTASRYQYTPQLPQPASASTASNYRSTSSPLSQPGPLLSQLTEELNRIGTASLPKARGTRKRR